MKPISTTRTPSSTARVAAIVAALGGIAVGTPAHAAELRTYPGMECKIAGFQDNDQNYVAPSGVLYNQTATLGAYLCPIAREDYVTGTQTGDVFVVDQSTSGDVCCSSQAYNPGGSFHFTSNVCTSGTSSNTKLHLDGPQLAGSWDARFFRCNVPAINGYSVSGIHTYRSREQ